jgi:hypothetical protein
MTSERDATIVGLYQAGARTVDLARQFEISRSRILKIIEDARHAVTQRAELEAKYGSKPNVATLPDTTLIEVLHLCEGKIQGWSARLGRLRFDAGIVTLGDLRKATDEHLLRQPMIGIKLLAELRRVCPQRNPGYGGKRYYKWGSLSTKLKRLDPAEDRRDAR